MRSFGMHIHTGDHGDPRLKEFCRVCTEFDSGETSMWAQSLAHNGRLSICWLRSIVLNLGFREWVLLHCTTDSPALSIHKCETLKSCSYPCLLDTFKSIVVNSRNCTAWSDHYVHVLLSSSLQSSSPFMISLSLQMVIIITVLLSAVLYNTIITGIDCVATQGTLDGEYINDIINSKMVMSCLRDATQETHKGRETQNKLKLGNTR